MILKEYWRGIEELRPLIYMSEYYEELNPEAFYVGANSDCETATDIVDPADLNPEERTMVTTYDGPHTDPVERMLYVGEYQAILCEMEETDDDNEGSVDRAVPGPGVPVS